MNGEQIESSPLVFNETAIPFFVFLAISIVALLCLLIGSIFFEYDLETEAFGVLTLIFLVIPLTIFAFKTKRRVLAYPNRCEVYKGRIWRRLDREFYWNAVSRAWIEAEAGEEGALSLRVNVNGYETVLLTRQYKGDAAFEALVELTAQKIEPFANRLT